MTLDYAEIIYDIVEKGLDTKWLAHLLEQRDAKQIHDLVEKLENNKNEYDYIYCTCKDPLIKEVSLLPISDRICEIQKEIEEL